MTIQDNVLDLFLKNNEQINLIIIKLKGKTGHDKIVYGNCNEEIMDVEVWNEHLQITYKINGNEHKAFIDLNEIVVVDFRKQ